MSNANLNNDNIAKKNGVIIIDNFFDNPDDIRKLYMAALSKGNIYRHAPTGGKYSPLYADNKTYIQIMKLLPTCKNNHDYLLHHGETRVVTATDPRGLSIIHKDLESYNVVIYLTPNHDGEVGTSFWDYVGDHDMDLAWLTHLKNTSSRDSWKAFHLISRETNYKNVWKKKYSVPWIYNRAVIFDADCWHSAGDFDNLGRFGNTLDTGRLIQYHNIEILKKKI